MVIRDALIFFRQPFARIAAVLAVILMGFGVIGAVASWVAAGQTEDPWGGTMSLEGRWHIPISSVFHSFVPGFIVLFLAVAAEYASRIASDLRFLRSKADTRGKEL